MDTAPVFLQLIEELKSVNYVNKLILQAFEERIAEHAFSKDENEEDHFGAFFIPYHSPTNSVYMGHHQKSGVWLLPGGHVDRDESPLQTVQREYAEELGQPLSNEPITLVDVEITHPRNDGYSCVTHYDYWFRIDVSQRIPYNFSHREYYTARWVTIEEARRLNIVKHYDAIIKDMPLRSAST